MPASACATIEGDQSAQFGIASDEGGIITQSIKVTHKREKKELRDKCGDVISVAHYNPMSEIEVEGVLNGAQPTVGLTFTFQNDITPEVVGTVNIDEVTIDMSNEDYVKVSIKGSAYEDL